MMDELDPSHALLDLANQMQESGVIVWLAPSKCSKRDDEVQMSLKGVCPGRELPAEGWPSVEVPEGDWNTGLKFQWCMMRRGLALNQCRVLSWSVHPTLDQLHAEPPWPSSKPRFSKHQDRPAG